MLRAWNGSIPLAGSIATFRIFSGDARRHLLDLDAALGRADQRHPPGVAVDQQAEIELARDVAALLDIDPLDLAARRSGLMGHEVLAQQRARRGRDFVFRAARA